MAQHLRRIFKLSGPADISAILPLYDGWYRQAKVRFEAQPNRALAAAYFNRHRVHIMKLAVICEASSSATLRVSGNPGAAVAMAAELERGIFSLLPTGMSREGYQLDKRAEKVRDAGVDGLPLSAFTRAFQHDNRMERYHRLETMTEAETVYCFQRGTTGRPAIYLVHRDFVDGYRFSDTLVTWRLSLPTAQGENASEAAARHRYRYLLSLLSLSSQRLPERRSPLF